MRRNPTIDPHLDPLRAPSPRGQHPHTHHISQENKNPQNMYEHRGQQPRMPALTRPLGAVPPPPTQTAPVTVPVVQKEGLFDNPLVLLGLGALALYAFTKMTEDKIEDAARQNPAPLPQTPQVIVVPAQGGIVTPAALDAVKAAVTTVQPAGKPPEAIKAPPKPKKRRTRKTTQKRDPETGYYLPAGTRKKAIVEGQKAEKDKK